MKATRRRVARVAVSPIMESKYMDKLGIILGSAWLDEPKFKKLKTETVNTDYGRVELKTSEHACFLQRHENAKPPHTINHKANIKAFHHLGIENIIAVNSCGSLRPDLKPGTIIVPDDYIDLLDRYTFFEDEMQFTVPGFNRELRGLIMTIAKRCKIETLDGGIYWQTRGPRFETKAEIRLMARFADIVGMTMANEATLATELGLKYAAICTVDNYAHGIGDEQLTWKKVRTAQKKIRGQVLKLLKILTKMS
jgi:5'-methylthioadenosine phosphorylase